MAAGDQHRHHHRNLPNGVLIQNGQNRDNAALQAKLDELIRVTKAKNTFIGIEHLSDKQLEDILAECEQLRPKAIRRSRNAEGSPVKVS